MSDEAHQVSRRDLFRGLLRRGQESYQATEYRIERLVPRPPGAVEETLFQHLCDGCGKCADNCPRSVLNMEAGFPVLSLDYNHCDLCGTCQSACPSGALKPTTKTGLKPEFTSHCHNKLLGYCELCIEDCPAAAISAEPGQLPQLDDQRCNGCGECKSSCPASAVMLTLSTN